MPSTFLSGPIFCICRMAARKSSRSSPFFEVDLLREPLGFLLVDRALRLLHQREDVALLEDPARQPVGMERLQRVELLAHADVLDRRVGDAVDRERRAAAGVAVHLGQDHAGDAERVVEALARSGPRPGRSCRRRRAGSRAGLTAALSRCSSPIISSSICSRPAVSTMTVRARALPAAAMPSRTIFTTSFDARVAVDADLDLLAERLRAARWPRDDRRRPRPGTAPSAPA